MKEYEEAKVFWNNTLKGDAKAIHGKFMDDIQFNKVLTSFIEPSFSILDFGCGSGWGLFELYYTKPFLKGIGVDQSINGIEYATQCAKLSSLDNILTFTTSPLSSFKENSIDAIFSCNTLDVIPLDIVKDYLKQMKRIIKNNGKILLSLNPYLTPAFNEKVHMESIGNHMFVKNGILRCLNLSNKDWENLFKEDFILLEKGNYQLSFEPGYCRRYFLLEVRK